MFIPIPSYLKFGRYGQNLFILSQFQIPRNNPVPIANLSYEYFFFRAFVPKINEELFFIDLRPNYQK